MQQEYLMDNDEITIDLLKIAKAFWKKLWLIFLVGVLLGALVFTYKNSTYVPYYTTTATMFVNTDSEANNGFSILTETCIAVLKTRMTLDEVSTTANLDIPYNELSGMISATAINNSPLFTISVTGVNPEEITLIANTIADVLPDMVSFVYERSNVDVVDYALVPTAPTTNNSTKSALTAAVLGMFLACAIIAVKVIYIDWKSSQERENVHTSD